MRDRLAHRGPDDAGEAWLGSGGGVSCALGHRRLSIIDPTPGGHQPMATPDGRYTIVYNGELYNEPELRRALEGEGVVFASASDTETLLHAVSRWGTAACARLRGMYAFALWDEKAKTLTLARDGLGVKPLYWTREAGDSGGRVVFASEIPAVLDHPGVSASPDWAAVSGYIATVRTTLDDRTIYDGVRTVRPGEWIRIDCSGEGIGIAREFPAQPGAADGGAGAVDLGSVVDDSVRAHLRSDVPWCSLLSGGLDSTVIATLAHERAGALRTYVSGCRTAGDGLADDFAYAGEASRAIGTVHAEVLVDEAVFVERWPAMVASLGVPMSTPNEVAILAVAERLRGDGHKVALSGEGADELFAGYELPMMSAARWVAENPDADGAADAAAALDSAAWMVRANKPLFLAPGMLDRAEGDAMLLAWYADIVRTERDAASAAESSEADARVRSFLGLQRRVNLAGLLQRLDTSTMLASVEGRVPFSDAVVADAARRIPIADLFRAGDPPGTKLALRRAFAGRVPASIAERPKRSFPLPFQGWLPAMAARASENAFLREVYTRDAIAFAAADPARHWNLAWPMFNLALWAENAFG